MIKKTTAVFLHLIVIALLSACSTSQAANIPSDFYLMMDARDPDHDPAKDVNIRIHANGKAEYVVYETGGSIQYDEHGVVSYEKDKIVQHGKFRLTAAQMEKLWRTIHEQRLFALSDKYQMQIGYSYAFILIEANGERHMVDNIGMEVPEMRALVETVAAMLPDEVNIEYGEGYKP